MSTNVVTGPADFSGTNTEKIDKLIATVIELRAVMRVYLYIMGVGFTLLIALGSYLVVETSRLTSEAKLLTYQNASMERKLEGLDARLQKLEQRK